MATSLGPGSVRVPPSRHGQWLKLSVRGSVAGVSISARSAFSPEPVISALRLLAIVSVGALCLLAIAGGKSWACAAGIAGIGLSMSPERPVVSDLSGGVTDTVLW